MFLQISEVSAINIDKITSIRFVEDVIEIFCEDDAEPWVVRGKRVEKFKQWWEEKADVYKL